MTTNFFHLSLIFAWGFSINGMQQNPTKNPLSFYNLSEALQTRVQTNSSINVINYCEMTKATTDAIKEEISEIFATSITTFDKPYVFLYTDTPSQDRNSFFCSQFDVKEKKWLERAKHNNTIKTVIYAIVNIDTVDTMPLNSYITWIQKLKNDSIPVVINANEALEKTLLASPCFTSFLTEIAKTSDYYENLARQREASTLNSSHTPGIRKNNRYMILVIPAIMFLGFLWYKFFTK